MKLTLRITEKEIQDEIVGWLEAEGYRVWRCNLGGIRSRGRGGNGWAKNPMKGYPDLGCTHRKHRGRLIGIEVKRPGGVLSDDQAKWHRWLRDEGALIIVAQSVADVRAAFAAVASEVGYSSAETPESADGF